MPTTEMYFEVGVLEGRTLAAAAFHNEQKTCWGCDTQEKYALGPASFPPNVRYIPQSWEQVCLVGFPKPLGILFYDGNHEAVAVYECLRALDPYLADEAVVVLDDWDRASTRQGAFAAAEVDGHYRLLREMPEYGDGLTCAPHHFGYYFGVAVWGYRRFTPL